MKLRLITVGKLSESYLREGADEFSRRIQHYAPLTTLELREEKGGGKKADPAFLRTREGERILEKIPTGAFVVILDERGRSMTSEGVAELLGRHMLQGTQEVVLVIGGAYGLSEAVKKRGDLLLSLSALTFTHQMARIFLLEQLYRGFTILRNEPYHNR